MTETLLVTGASGQLGRGVIRYLLDAHKTPPAKIIATTRNPESLADLAVRGVVVRAADFNDAISLETAFKGADKALIISTGDLDLKSGKRLKQHENAVAAAKNAGVSHLLYTSMPNPEPVSPVLFAGDHYSTEQAIKASGIPYTIFRNGWYQENLFMALPQAIASGHWYTSAGEGRIAHGARDDSGDRRRSRFWHDRQQNLHADWPASVHDGRDRRPRQRSHRQAARCRAGFG